MGKPELVKIYEPAENLVHYAPFDIADAVTLCGKTDWIGEETGWEVDNAVNCNECNAIVEHIHKHRNPLRKISN